MAFPIWAQRIGSQTVRVEEASERIERMITQLEKEASGEADEKPKRRSSTIKAKTPLVPSPGTSGEG